MDNDNEIFHIFLALAGDNQEFIDKNDFLKKISNFTDNPDEMEGKYLIQIKNLMKQYSKIGFDEFKILYSEIQRIKRESIQSVDDEKLSDSSGSSDIDDCPENKIIKYKKENLSSSSVNSSIKSESFLSSPKSARKHGLELLNNSKTSFLKRLNSPLIADTDTNIMSNSEPNEQVDKLHLRIEEMSEENDRLKEEIENLQKQLRDEERRYLNEKDQHKLSLGRICALEHQIDNVQLGCKDEVKKINEEFKSKLQSMEMVMEQTKEQFKTRSADCDKQIFSLNKEKENLAHQCQQLSLENETLHRECRFFQSQKHENEIILMEYKQVASKQVTELQTERDQLELANKQLYTELQTIKHTSPSRQLKHRSLVVEPTAPVKTRPLSTVESPELGRENDHIEKEDDLTKSHYIESDVNKLVHSLTMENRNLVERIAHLETVGFYQRQKLEAANCLSLAAEMEQLNLEELQKALTVERETVKTLQKYMETLTTKLLTAGYIDVFQQA